MVNTRVPAGLLLSLLRLPLTIAEAVFSSLRMGVRCFGLGCLLIPLAIVYPLGYRSASFGNLWWHCFLWALQACGPTFVKLGQWASTRRDLLSKVFCDRVLGAGFVTTHGAKVFKSIEPFSIGSGCIAQVYKATINVREFEKATGRTIPSNLKGRETVDIAIKIAEKGVEKKMEQDLSIIRFLATVAVHLMPSLKYLDPLGAVNQFEMVLRRQVDLSNEARALQRFAENFDAKATGVKFPTVLAHTKNAIIETYEEGIYINKLISEDEDPKLKSRQSPAVRRRIALIGARALLKMLFVDNFIHGDLHPGNILVRFNDNTETLPGVHKAFVREGVFQKMWERVSSLLHIRSQMPRIRFTDSPFIEDEPVLVLLDTGIAISETPENLRNLRTLFRAVVEKKGYEVGHLLLTHSLNQQCKDPEAFCQQVAELVHKARSQTSLRMLNISAVLSQLFSIVAEHRVSLDSSFTSVVLSIMVLEGFGRSLDPDLDLFQCARPYLLNVLV